MKKLPKRYKIAQSISRFAINAKLTSPKKLRLFHFSIFSSEIFRISVELPQDLIYMAKFAGQNTEYWAKKRPIMGVAVPQVPVGCWSLGPLRLTGPILLVNGYIGNKFHK